MQLYLVLDVFFRTTARPIPRPILGVLVLLANFTLLDSAHAIGEEDQKGACQAALTTPLATSKRNSGAKAALRPPPPQKATVSADSTSRPLSTSDEALAWELSRQGLAQLQAQLPYRESLFYYLATALLAKEHLWANGPFGGAKTLILRKVFQAQLRSRLINDEQRAQFEEDKVDFVKGLMAIKQELQELTSRPGFDKDKGNFFLQCHQMMTRIPILGGPDVFHQLKTGEARTDYQNALISDENIFALIDEYEKAPAGVQMLFLSILQERRAYVDNKVVKTLLETVAVTSNASLAAFLNDVETPEEIGGREALLSRLALKAFVVNTAASADELVDIFDAVQSSALENEPDTASPLLDLLSIRQIMQRVEVPDRILQELVRLGVFMDRTYTAARLENEREAQRERRPPDFYPPFDGTIRSFARVLKLTQAAFVVQQLLMGVPYSSIRYKMEPEDLVSLAPAVLQGGPSSFKYHIGFRVPFIQTANGLFPQSNLQKEPNSKGAESDAEKPLIVSEGFYQPKNGLFSYISTLDYKRKAFFFDPETGKLTVADPKEVDRSLRLPLASAVERVRTELEEFRNTEDALSRQFLESHMDEVLADIADIEANLARFHAFYLSQRSNNAEEEDHLWSDDGRNETLLSSGALRTDSAREIERIAQANSRFIGELNQSIRALREGGGGSAVSGALAPVLQSLTEDKAKRQHRANQLRENLEQLRAKEDAVTNRELYAHSWETGQLAFEELTSTYIDVDHLVTALFESIISKQHAILMGGPGGAKTQLSYVVLQTELEHVNDNVIAEANSLLASHLKTHMPEQAEKFSIFVNQFHMFSTEQEIIGYVDLKALEEGRGYRHNSTGTASAKQVLLMLLDEFEKAPAGVKMSVMSLLNERAIFRGHETVATALSTAILSSNTTPDEFLRMIDKYPSAIALWDRISRKVFVTNKATQTDLEGFLSRQRAGVNPELSTPLYLSPLQDLLSAINVSGELQRLASKLIYETNKEKIKRHNQEREAFLEGSLPHFYEPSFAESDRSAVAAVIGPGWRANYMVRQMRSGKSFDKVFTSDGAHVELQIEDLIDLGRSLIGRSPYVDLTILYRDGRREFALKEKDWGELEGRLSERELRTIKDYHWEAKLVSDTLNEIVRDHLKAKSHDILRYPSLFPTEFLSVEARIRWLKAQGYSDQEIEAHYGQTAQ